MLLPDTILLTTDLITPHAIALQKRRKHLDQLHSKVYEARIQAAICLEHDYANTIHDFNFKLSDLVLICNTHIEKLLNQKM